MLAQRIAEPNEPTDRALRRAARCTLEELRHLAPAVGLGEQVGERADAFLVIAVVGDDALPRRDRGIEIVALLVMDQRDADEVGALLVRRRCLARRGSRATATRSSQRCWLSRMLIRASSAETSDGSLSTRRSHSESARSVSPSDSASLAASLRIAARAASFPSRCAWRSSTASRSFGWFGLRVERGEPARDDELFVLRRAADRRCLDEQARSRLCVSFRRSRRVRAASASSSTLRVGSIAAPRAAAATPSA